MPALLFDLAEIDLNAVLFDRDAIRATNPQRGDMEHLDAIVYAAPEINRMVGYKDVRADEFWCEGHIPGRPLFPGVLMLEAAAQMASFYTTKYVGLPGFIAFGGVENCRFRATVTPGCRLHLLLVKTSVRRTRVACDIQGILGGKIVFDAQIIGAAMSDPAAASG